MKKTEELKYRQLGMNILITIDGKKLSKTEKDKAKRDSIINKIKLYNKLNSEAKKKELITLFSKLEEKKTKETAIKKGVKKGIKKVEKDTKRKDSKIKSVKEKETDLIKELTDKANSGGLTDKDISNLEDIIKKSRKLEEIKEEAKPTVINSNPKRGEY